jgi:enhancing lycopene biosynthesis protein 2
MAGAKKRIGVILSGCGYLDGAEIHEAVVTLLALDRRGADVVIAAPDVEQADVIDHRTGEPSRETRRVLAEASRIARGRIVDLAKLAPDELDGLILPGGYGAAKNLCNFASAGDAVVVNADVERVIRALRRAGKPMGFICIAPVIAAKVLGEERPLLTIGDDRATAAALEKLGARHEDRPVDAITIDQRLKLVSTPAYMLGPSIAAVAAGIEKLVAAVLELA